MSEIEANFFDRLIGLAGVGYFVACDWRSGLDRRSRSLLDCFNRWSVALDGD